MKTLDELGNMTRQELILHVWELQKIPNLMKELKARRVQETMLVLVEDEPESFIAGMNNKLVAHLMTALESVCEASGETMESILHQIMDRVDAINRNPVNQGEKEGG